MEIQDTNRLIKTAAPQIRKPTPIESNLAIASARFRLNNIAATLQRRRQLTSADEEYYGEGHEGEDAVAGFTMGENFDAFITRNRYGCVILNANRALFIDVDVEIDGPKPRSRDPWLENPHLVFDDIRTVLANEMHEGFRIYRTAAGFRILAVGNEYTPGSNQSLRLMNAVGADSHFSHLCKVQSCFRARLTPKPWRCGVRRSPHEFPRRSFEHQRCFAEWLSQYEHACQDRATCQFLEHVGSSDVHDRVASIIEVHDRETKAMQSLPLA